MTHKATSPSASNGKTYRRRFTPESLERLRQTALSNKPWKRATGPRTPQGRAQMVLNGEHRQQADKSVRELQAELSVLDDLYAGMHRCCELAARARENPTPGT